MPFWTLSVGIVSVLLKYCQGHYDAFVHVRFAVRPEAGIRVSTEIYTLPNQ